MDHRRVIEMLSATPLRVRRLADGFSADLARQRPGTDGWSAAEVVLHLVEGDRDTFVPRLRRMLAEETPVFAAGRPARAADATLDLSVLLDVFAQARGQATALLGGLDPSGWRRTGVSPSRGRLTIEAYAAAMADHDREHLRQLNAVRVGVELDARRCEAGDPIPPGELAASVAATPARLAALIGELGAETLRRRPAPAEWSMKEVVAHLLSVERDLFLPRLVRMRAEERPVFEPFDPAVWAAARDWRRGDARVEAAEFGAVRARTVALLRGLRPDELGRVGVSSAFGAMTLHEYATHVAEHDAEHLAQLATTRRVLAGG